CIDGLIGRDHICSENFLFAKASTDVAIPDDTFEDIFKNFGFYSIQYIKVFGKIVRPALCGSSVHVTLSLPTLRQR
ncbi:893_t:CDS:1, partial [Dentiscutata erythropus]